MEEEKEGSGEERRRMKASKKVTCSDSKNSEDNQGEVQRRKSPYI